MNEKKELEKKFQVYQRHNGNLITPTEDYWGKAEEVFGNYDSEEDAVQAILEKGDLFVEYIVLPCYRVTNF